MSIFKIELDFGHEQCINYNKKELGITNVKMLLQKPLK